MTNEEQLQSDFDGALMRLVASVSRVDSPDTVRGRREVVRGRYASAIADLLATRRALKMAQAKALAALADALTNPGSKPSRRIYDKGFNGFYVAGAHRGLTVRQRAIGLVDHYANLFEREAKGLSP